MWWMISSSVLQMLVVVALPPWVHSSSPFNPTSILFLCFRPLLLPLVPFSSVQSLFLRCLSVSHHFSLVFPPSVSFATFQLNLMPLLSFPLLSSPLLSSPLLSSPLLSSPLLFFLSSPLLSSPLLSSPLLSSCFTTPQTPGPGTYKVIDSSLTRLKSPSYSLRPRVFPPDAWKGTPGPGAYSPEKV